MNDNAVYSVWSLCCAAIICSLFFFISQCQINDQETSKAVNIKCIESGGSLVKASVGSQCLLPR